MVNRPVGVTAGELRAELEDLVSEPRTSLHLHGGGGTVGAHELHAALRRSPDLAELWIQGCVFEGDSLGDALADALEHTPRIRSLRLTSVGELGGFGQLGCRLGGLPLRSLWIHGTELRADDLEDLASLMRGTGPPRLRLSFLPVRGEAAVSLARAAVAQPRELLQFTRCDLEPDALKALAEAPAPVGRLVVELNRLRGHEVRLLAAAHPDACLELVPTNLELDVRPILRDVARARRTSASL